jgi:hypothetical protein
MYRSSFIGLASALLFACAGEPGTRPHDASSADHEAMARQEDQAADAHSGAAKASGSDQSTAKNAFRCGRGGCWTSSANSTEQHRKDAERHRELAAKHRAASAALVSAEQQACEGLSEDDRDMSPFNHREDIRSVSVLEESVQAGKAAVKKTTGATIEFKAVEGMTAEWLQRVVDCHIARAAAMGHNMPEMDYCPLVPKDVKATVASTGNGFAVKVTSDNPATIKEILRRAEALDVKN